MPFPNCIAAALADGLIDSERAHEFNESYAQHEEALREQMTPHEAASEAARLTFAELEQDTAERRRQTFLTLAARADIVRRLDSHISWWRHVHDAYQGALGLYDRLMPNRNGLAVEQQREFWRGQAHATMDEAFHVYKRDLLGCQGRPANEDAIVDEAFGRDTGDAQAKAIAGGWIKTRELLRAGFNRFGGHIGSLEDYGFPIFHAARLINAVSKEEWISFVTPLLDRRRILTRAGTRPLGDRELQNALSDMYDNIVTQSWAGREATSRNPRASSLANRRDEARFLQWASPDAWRTYQRRFGEGNVFDTMLHHIDTMSRDIAHMQVMGPNPAATVAWLKNELERRANLAEPTLRSIGAAARALGNNPRPPSSRSIARGQRARATVAAYHLDNLYAQYSGHANAPVLHWWAEVEGDVRNVVGSALLGSATLTAVPTDWNFSRMTRAFNGLPQLRAMGAYVKLLNPASDGDRMLAARLGLTAEGYGRTLHDSARALDQLYGHQWSKWLVDRTLTYNALSPHTDAGRWSYGWTAQGALAQEAHTAWAALDPKFRDSLERYRIGEAEWDQIRATPLYADRGASFLRPGDIMARRDLDSSRALELGQRVADWIMTETEFAVPSSSLAGRAIGRGAVRPGTIQSFFLSSPLMFKTFAMTYLLSHGRRILAQADPLKRAQYFGSLVVLSTLAGAVALQLREIAQGRDPRDMTRWQFWPQAMIVGGGFGMLGDFLNSASNSQNRSVGEYIGGPIVGLVADIGRLAVGAPLAAAENKNPQKGRSGLINNTLSFVKRYTPGGNIWYLRAVLERYVFDALQEAVDPQWKQRLHRVERWYRTNYGQHFWWRRGDQPGLDNSQPRAPNLKQAVGAQP